MQLNSKIYVAGHQGLLGSALISILQAQGYTNRVVRTLQELDLRNQAAVHTFFEQQRPEYVLLAAAKVGGIKANNDHKAEFIYDNIMIQTNVIHASWHYGVKKLLFLGSSCIYPRLAPQPIIEESLLTGSLEPTNESYALAKIAGIKMCQAYRHQYGVNFISAMPTNLYGPHDTFDEQRSHVIPALIIKIINAYKQQKPFCEVWGTGEARREFLYVQDCAQALLHLMHHYDQQDPINIGYGNDISIKQLAELIAKIIGYQGAIIFDTLQPSGTPQKLLNNSKIQTLGWKPSITLQKGLKVTINWYKNNH